MIKDFIIDASMLVAIIGVCYQMFRNTGINPMMPTRLKLVTGGIFGVLGIVLMIFGIHLPNNIIIDYRNLALLVAAISGGCIPAVITGFIMCIGRIFLSGITAASIMAVGVIIILTLLFCFITKLNIKKWNKWVISTIISEIITCITLSILIKDTNLLKEILIYYCLSISLLTILLYYYVGYIDSLTESYRMFRNESKIDYLTGLNNVRQFDGLYNAAERNVLEKKEKISLLYIDIDFFKKINDTYGHKEGDIVLKELSNVLKKMCRNIDIVSRNGGEEFSIILIDCTAEKAVEIAEGIRKYIENHVIELSNKHKVKITVSIGIASYPDTLEDLEKLREKADVALYEAKRTGRNKVVLSKE